MRDPGPTSPAFGLQLDEINTGGPDVPGKHTQYVVLLHDLLLIASFISKLDPLERVLVTGFCLDGDLNEKLKSS